jgi:uncharacterized protein YndB with AHSA1/START domain
MENLERNTQQNTVNITRVFDAPREAVWKAWTDPESVKQWWGPRDYTCPAAKIDLRVGGKILNAMKGPDGKVIWGGGNFTEITKPSRLSYTDSFTDEQGNVVDPKVYDMPADFARELYVTVTFEEQGPDKTKMTLVHKPFPNKSIADDCVGGWSQSFDKLEELLEQQPGA